MQLKVEGGPSNTSFMKCVACLQFHVKSPWGWGGGCKRMQKCVNETTRAAPTCFWD